MFSEGAAISNVNSLLSTALFAIIAVCVTAKPQG